MIFVGADAESVMTRTNNLTPSAIDRMTRGSLKDPVTPGLAIEALSSGGKVWRYARRVAGCGTIVRMRLGRFPAYSVAVARDWAAKLNAEVEAGIDPRETIRAAELRASMTVAKAHGLYMHAVREGRASRAKRRNKPRTVADKLAVYERDIAPELARKIIYDVTERDLIALVEKKGRAAPVRANRLAAELKVFFGWAASLRGLEVGLEVDPSRRLGDLRFPEVPRSRKLEMEEIGWFLKSLVEEELDYRRGMLLWLLSAARLGEVSEARSAELADGVWTIPASRTKNSVEHAIPLGPWGWSLMQCKGEWVFPAPRRDGPRSRNCWYVARNRVRARMEELAGRPVARFTPHDFRRTSRSNTKRLKVDFETAEAMLNHVKKGLERTYDTYELEEEKRSWFLLWEGEIARLARRLQVAEALGVPDAVGGSVGE